MAPIKTQEIVSSLPRMKQKRGSVVKVDVVVIGAGPTGLACGIEAQKVGAKVLVIDKGCLVNSIYHYPANMLFFTTPELLEIGDIPFTTANQKPTREEALEYYRNVTRYHKLKVSQYERVMAVEENFFYSAPHRYLGVIYAKAPLSLPFLLCTHSISNTLKFISCFPDHSVQDIQEAFLTRVARALA